MSTDTIKTHKKNEEDSGRIGGIILVVIGFFFLLNQFVNFDFGTYFLPILASFFIVAGIVKQKAGLFIPGGIIAGISLGAVLMDSPLAAVVNDEGGLFMLAFAAGWVLIPLLSVLFTSERHWWALIPAGIIAFIGLSVSFGGVWLTLLGLVGQAWPLILIAVGVFILLKSRQPKVKAPDDIEWLE